MITDNNLSPLIQPFNQDIFLDCLAFNSDAADLVALSGLNRALKDAVERIIPLKYEAAFGQIADGTDTEMRPPLVYSVGKQPNKNEEYRNVFEIPKKRLDRWKWIVGLENSLDQEVKRQYASKINLLEKTQASTIEQLKNQLVAYWHTDRQILNYDEFKKKEQKSATTGRIKTVFFACVKFFLGFYYNKSPLIQPAKFLHQRSREIFAKIGGFDLNDKSYAVVATHPMKMEEVEYEGAFLQPEHESVSPRSRQPIFESSLAGGTRISIIEESTNSPLRILDLNQTPYFDVLIGRRVKDGKKRDSEVSYFRDKTSENYSDAETNPVLNKKRSLVFRNGGVDYCGAARSPNGSNRELDQKLTQVIIEMGRQNREIASIQAEYVRDQLPLLVAGGFVAEHPQQTALGLNFINEFREDPEHHLFPPYRDYGCIPTKYLMDTYDEPNVRFLREGIQSWAEIIEEEPILRPGAAILPEYWVKKPNIVEDEEE